MNVFTATAILQLLLVVRGSDALGDRRRVGCYYLGVITKRYSTFLPENMDTSICTHVSYLHGGINNETHEIYLKPPTQDMKTGGESSVPRLVKLKSENPDLKLSLHILFRETDWLLQEDSRSKILRSGLKWLNESGFDGLDFNAFYLGPEKTDKMADFICEMKKELDKYGFFVTTAFTGPGEILEETISKFARCSEYISLLTHFSPGRTHRMAPMSTIKLDVEWYVERGLPRSKILVALPTFGAIFRLEDPKDTELGAAITGPGNDDREMMGGMSIHYKDLLRKLNDSSLGWTIRRDNETKEPYAFSTTGLWTSYEDTASMEYKARYVLEEGLGGMDTVGMEFEDDDGIGGEGSFPLTRTVYNILTQRNQTTIISN